MHCGGLFQPPQTRWSLEERGAQTKQMWTFSSGCRPLATLGSRERPLLPSPPTVYISVHYFPAHLKGLGSSSPLASPLGKTFAGENRTADLGGFFLAPSFVNILLCGLG